MEKKEKNRKLKQPKSIEVAQTFRQLTETSGSDVLGSYIGTPKDGEKPEQDADDL